MAETVIAVPAELLAGMLEAQRDGVTAMREARAEAAAARAEVLALRKAFDDHATREEPAFAAYADHLRRLAEADAEVSVDARTAAKRAEIAAAEAAAAAAAQRERDATERAKEKAETRAMIVKIALGIATLATTMLAAAAGGYALGGP